MTFTWDRIRPSLVRLRFLLEPALGALFFIFWTVAEIGRQQSCTVDQVGCTEEVQTQLNLRIAGFFILLGLYALAIALSRSFPFVSLLLVIAVPFLQIGQVFAPFLGTAWPVYAAAVFVMFFVAVYGTPLVRWLGLGIGLSHAALVSVIVVLQSGYVSGPSVDGVLTSGLRPDTPDLSTVWGFFALVALLSVVAWVTGVVLRLSVAARRGRQALDQTTAQLTATGYELDVARERDRIAGEVHDVLAHSLTVVVAVADGSRFAQASQPETTSTALQHIADTARSALLELRRLVERLRDTGESEPEYGLADIPPLLTQVSAAGVKLSSSTAGPLGTLSSDGEFATYRIVQESLTNVLRHAGTNPTVHVSMTWTETGLTGRVASSGTAPAEPRETTLLQRTYGVSGMKERARSVGGTLSADRDHRSGEFVVTFFIPAHAASPTDPGSEK